MNDYEIITQTDENGRESTKLEYRGDLYQVQFSKGNLAKYSKILRLLVFSTLALHIGAGFLNNPGMRNLLIAIPYVGAFLPFYYLAAGTIALPKSVSPYCRDEIDLSFKRVRSVSFFLCILFAFIIISEIILLLIIHSGKAIISELLFFILEFTAGLVIVFITFSQKRISIKKQPAA